MPQTPPADQYRQARLEKAERLRAAGHDPFGRRFQPTATVRDARLLAPEATPDDEQPRGSVVRLAGRIGNLRKAGGKLRFATLFDRTRAERYLEQVHEGVDDIDGPEAAKDRGIQLFLERGAVGEEDWEGVVKNLDLADWVGVEGPVGRSKTGEISVFVERIDVLGKALQGPSHQKGATRQDLTPELRQRHRERDLMESDASLATFLVRSRLIGELRAYFLERGYWEVETPMLHTVLGGAAARPFVTHHNALDLDLYLRIAPELHLKRLIVGGMERVFELNRNFRNEGIDTQHNPEFTMVEWYEAYADHDYLMDFTEQLLRELADRVIGRRTLRFRGHEIDLDQPFRRLDYREALRELGGLDYDDQEAVAARARELGLDPADFGSHERLVNEVWEQVVEPQLVQPTFITGQPLWLTPLCRSSPEHADRSLRFELFVARMELANAYTELNDPDEQRSRFGQQITEAAASGDEEAGVAGGRIDDDYCIALEHGLPACGGEGMGIDRLVMLLTGSDSIRDVILFPTMRPK